MNVEPTDHENLDHKEEQHLDNSKIPQSSIMSDDFLDSETFRFVSYDEDNLTGSEEDNSNKILAACSEEIFKSLNSISTTSASSADQGNIKADSLGKDETLHISVSNRHINQINCVEEISAFKYPRSDGENANERGESFNDGDYVSDDRSGKLGSVIAENISKNLVDIPNGISNATLTKEHKITNKGSVHNIKKLNKILLALESNDIDFLRIAAVSADGLLNDDIRKKVWPKLVGVDVIATSPRPSLKEIEAHPYYNQVLLDVNRSLKRFPPSIKEAQRLTMLDQLVFLIMRVLCCHPEMHYYQGYHDICVTFLLVLGEETAFHVIEKLSQTHLGVFMEKNMEPTIHLLEHMFVLIGKKKPVLKNFLLKSEVGIAYCLSWLITWFGHVLNDYDCVVRLFDFFIVSHSWMPVYLTAAIVMHRESEVLKQECDMASVHSLLSNISDDLPFEDLLLQSLQLFDCYEPNMLSKEHPYIKRNKLKPKKGWGLYQSISRTIKSAVPANKITLPIIIAAAVLVTAVLYQAYK